MTLPDTKNVPGRDPLNKKTLLYGPQKIGKSTLVSKLYPNAAYIATDPTGLEELEVFKADCRDWATFRRIGQELALYLRDTPAEERIYDAICVDTVDELVRFCRQDVLAGLSGGPAQKKPDDFLHESDWEYGKAWNAVTEEFRIRVARLCSLGLPVVFISHSKNKVKKNRTGLEITVSVPDIGAGQAGEWLLKFVDYIFFAEMIGEADGERRILHTMPSEQWLAGARQPEGKPLLPEPLPLDGARLRSALLATTLSAAAAQDVDQKIANDLGVAIETDSFLSDKPKRRVAPQNGKNEPKTVQRAREIVAAIDEKKVSDDGYTAQQRKALETIAKYEAKQKEAATA
jgi:hypothetical protein